MKESQQLLIGIAGGSCSGKTTLVRALEGRLGQKLTTVSFDEYFIGTAALGERNIKDWENPDLYHYDRFVADLVALKTGETINIQCNSRESREQGLASRLIIPRRYTIVEGFLIFHHEEARLKFDKKIFIDIPKDEMIRRRIARSGDKTDRWNNPAYINKMLIPGYEKYVLPQRDYADVVMDGLKSTEELAEEVIMFIR